MSVIAFAWAVAAIMTAAPLAVDASATLKSLWRVVPSANAAASDDLSSVSCPQGGFCMAVGRYFLSDPHKCQQPVTQTLTEGWDGTAWSVIGSPNAGCSNDELYAVSCPRSDRCTAVGAYVGNPTWKTLVEVFRKGSWSIVPSANVGSGANVLHGVSCLASGFCTAVGESDDAVTGIRRTLVEVSSSAGWSVVPSPNPGTTDNALFGVSCTSPQRCQAVGVEASGPGTFSALMEAWNGSVWSVEAGQPASLLSAVTCVSSTSCTAVGYSESGGVVASLIEAWNGSSWVTVPSPNQPSGFNALAGVSCISTSACVAVGYSGNFQTLIEVWNGAVWVISASPNVGSGSNLLKGVSCMPSGRCKAVGAYQSSPSDSQTLVEASHIPTT